MSEPEMLLSNYLTPERITISLNVSSRKRLLEHLAERLSDSDESLSKEGVFKTLTERERLGSTGLGAGIAIPHGRMSGLQTPVLAVARLVEPIDFDAPDDLPVWLAVSLLVPKDACADHLKLLAILAGKLNKRDFCDALMECDSPERVYRMLTEREKGADLRPLSSDAV
jgi:PTS system nitrogen regulatory IIA component